MEGVLIRRRADGGVRRGRRWMFVLAYVKDNELRALEMQLDVMPRNIGHGRMSMDEFGGGDVGCGRWEQLS